MNAAADAMRGVLENGVRTAYQVIDEYMRRGYEAAGNNHKDPNRRGPMNDNRKTSDAQNPWAAMSQLTEQWLTAMRAWTDAWSTFVPGNWPTQPWNSAGRPAAISVQVLSTRPAEVTASLGPGAELMDLVADSLQCEGVDAPPIDSAGISIKREPGRVRVNIKVSPDQPAGRYKGPIRNRADGNVAGELAVVITDNSE